MPFSGKNVIVTGGADGIGRAVARQFVDAGASVCVFDVQDVALPGMTVIRCNVSDEKELLVAISRAEETMGSIDIYVSNAGVFSHQAECVASAPNADWQQCWTVNVMAHVYAARAVLPGMMATGKGHFVVVASAAGLLNQIGDAAYSATKHAAVSFADSLAITHGSDGIGVSLVCPQYVATSLIGLSDEDAQTRDSLMTADEVAACVLEGIHAGKYRILPHTQVSGYAEARARDHDRWIEKMQALRTRAIRAFGDAKPERFYRLL